MAAETKPHILMLASSRSVHTARWANGLRNRGWRITLMTADPDEVHEYDDIPLVRLPGSGKGVFITGGSFVKKWVSENDIAFIHAFYATDYGFLATFSRCAPVLLSVMGTDVFSYPEKSWLHKWGTARILKSAQTVAATSQVMASRVEELTRGKVKPAVTPFGVDTNIYKPADAPELEKKADQPVRIISIRHLHFKYGLDLLITAAGIIRREKPKLKFAVDIYGDGPERAKLQLQIDGLGLRDCITLHGKAAPERVPDLLRNADMFIAPSREESFGVAVLEASACGLPVIGSRVGGLPEVIREGETGLLFGKENAEELADQILRLSEPEIARKFGKAGSDFVKSGFSEEMAFKLMSAVYEKLLVRIKA
ncbi:MAG: glycosyltransferase [Balneolia bacterium]|nr:glycosyltransferase [Balneolia bacterium]